MRGISGFVTPTRTPRLPIIGFASSMVLTSACTSAGATPSSVASSACSLSSSGRYSCSGGSSRRTSDNVRAREYGYMSHWQHMLRITGLNLTRPSVVQLNPATPWTLTRHGHGAGRGVDSALRVGRAANCRENFGKVLALMLKEHVQCYIRQ